MTTPYVVIEKSWYMQIRLLKFYYVPLVDFDVDFANETSGLFKYPLLQFSSSLLLLSPFEMTGFDPVAKDLLQRPLLFEGRAPFEVMQECV